MLISYLFSPVKVFKIKVIFKARLVKNENAKELTKPRLQCQSVAQAKLVEVSRGQPDSEAEGGTRCGLEIRVGEMQRLGNYSTR